MQIYSGTGVERTEELRVTKGIGAITVSTDKELNELTTEKISVFVERQTGTNEQILQDVPLLHFILASTYGESNIFANLVDGQNTGFSALCHLVKDGAIMLEADEAIKIELYGLDASKNYTLDGIEYPEFSTDLIQIDKKTFLSEQTEKDYAVYGLDSFNQPIDYELAIIDNVTQLTRLELTYDNGVRTKYSLRELRAMSLDIESFYGFKNDNSNVTYNDIPDILVLPVIGVSQIHLSKDSSSGLVNLSMYYGVD